MNKMRLREIKLSEVTHQGSREAWIHPSVSDLVPWVLNH